MLGYKAEASFFKSYPVVKLADFGLAQLTGPDDKRNPKAFHGIGSAAYMPPVGRKLGT
jgi:serine/threonine protein kinase